MQKITFEAFGYDQYDDEIKFRVSIVSGLISSSLEFHGYPDMFDEFAKNLLLFPKSVSDTVLFEVGRDEAGWAYFMLLKVYCYENNGYTAIEITIDNHQQSPDIIRTKFAIKTVPAEINRLGELLLKWNPKIENELIWVSNPR